MRTDHRYRQWRAACAIAIACQTTLSVGSARADALEDSALGFRLDLAAHGNRVCMIEPPPATEDADCEGFDVGTVRRNLAALSGPARRIGVAGVWVTGGRILVAAQAFPATVSFANLDAERVGRGISKGLARLTPPGRLVMIEAIRVAEVPMYHYEVETDYPEASPSRNISNRVSYLVSLERGAIQLDWSGPRELLPEMQATAAKIMPGIVIPPQTPPVSWREEAQRELVQALISLATAAVPCALLAIGLIYFVRG